MLACVDKVSGLLQGVRQLERPLQLSDGVKKPLEEWYILCRHSGERVVVRAGALYPLLYEVCRISFIG